MKYLFICNTSSDCISKVNLDTFKEENKITLGSSQFNKIGPHDICRYKEDKAIVANSYDNSISIIDTKKDKEIDNYFVGMHCNDVDVLNDYAYVVCGETNNLVVFDLIRKSIVEEIPCGGLPHSIRLNENKKLILISNMDDDSITLVDIDDMQNIKKIRVGAYPTKSIFSSDGKYIYVCESNLGADTKGALSIVSIDTFKVVYRIKAGYSPVDVYCEGKYCYVSNFGDGTISIIDMEYYNEIHNIEIGGMPRGIAKVNDYIYIGDNYNNCLIKFSLLNSYKKNIPIGGEPTGILLI